MAATDVERLAILIEANTTQFTKAMQKLQRDTNRAMGQSTRAVRTLDTQMKSAAISARNFMGIFGVTVGLAGISRLLDDLDNLGKVAQRTGVDVEELQALIHAASLSGADSAGLVRSFERLNEEIAKASVGSTQLGDILKANNVSIRDANGDLRSSKDLYFEIADLIKNAANQQEAALIARLAFGRSSRELIPLLQQGADGLRDQAQAARDAGVVIDREIIASAERFNDAWETAWLGFRGNAFNGISSVIGFFDNLDARLREFGREHGLDIFGGGGGGRKPLEITLTNPGGPPARETVIPVKTEGGAGRGRGTSAIERQRQAVVDLIADLEHEQRVMGLSEAQRQVENTLRQAGAAATDEQRVKIEALVRQIHAADEAAQAAEAQMAFFGSAAMNALDGLILRGDKAKDVLGNLVRMMAQAALQASLFGQGQLGSVYGISGATGETERDHNVSDKHLPSTRCGVRPDGWRAVYGGRDHAPGGPEGAAGGAPELRVCGAWPEAASPALN